MRLRLLVFAWLLSAVTNADEVESVSESPELAEESGMVSSNNEAYSKIGQLSSRNFFNALKYSGPSTGSILVSKLQLLKAGKCVSSEILWWLGASKEQIADAYAARDADQVECSLSSDGSLTTRDSEDIPSIDTINPKGRVGGHRLDDPTFENSYKSDELEGFNKTLLIEPVTKEQYQNMQNFCNTSGCHFQTIIALVFAGANYFDALGRPIAAAMHRLVAFDVLDLQSLPKERSHRIQKTNFKDGLTLHAEALLKYSFDTEDHQLANEAKYILTRLEALDTETETRLNEWELNLEGAVTPISVTLPLVADTPVSKYHYAVSKGLALKEFGITSDGVDLAYAFLQCSEKQVTLVTAARSAWVIPDDWEDCRLTLLSDEPTKATITEYPDGYVDRNGSLII